ncbi:phosphonate metabolism transcriptional regulator PhnF [Pseudovibrio exalbescens]|uniref:phosphonate metabolism transcriptional regulator PhnF n=1 Tax=Pseudovibrio exalbescens TaxID=197461 RepID=UPI002366D1C3|nr:phosphonate metabolism transcriptional regulator PhnF [Pseudovibrio exalbescens]MDD7911786.1 phosphonate metabolism transcriptional regulator PhnF [Pseudovibrio exalbescens]
MFHDKRMTDQLDFEGRPVKRRAGIAVWKQIAETLRIELTRAGLGEGARIPTEQVLAEKFSVNRHTVRRAISVLIEEGLLRSDQGRGTFVAKSPIAYKIGPRTRFTENLRDQAETISGRLLGIREVEADDLLAAELQVAIGTVLFEMQTLSLADGVPLITGTGYFEKSKFPTLEADYLETRSITKVMQKMGYGNYRRGETRITAVHCSKEHAAILEIEAGSPMIATYSVDVLEDGTPIQVGRSYMASERIQLTV